MLSRTRAPSEEAFLAWKDDPITRFVLDACARAADQCEESWAKRSWSKGDADPEGLLVARTRADAYNALADTDYEGWCLTLGLEPVYAPERG